MEHEYTEANSSLYNPNYFWVLGWEKEPYGTATLEWIKTNTAFMPTFIVGYLILVFGGEAYMKNKDRLDLTRALILWNIFLCLFSVFFSVRAWTESIYVLERFGLTYFVCNSKDGLKNNVNNTWLSLFIFSKLLEFGDTAFIILRKRKLIFLHWFHHLTVPILLCFATSVNLGLGRSLMLFNSTIHSLMYFYYAIATAKVRVPKLLAMSLTALQISQVIFACGVACLALRFKWRGEDCEFPDSIVFLSLIMFLVYLTLFCNYFYQSYINTSGLGLKLKKTS